VLPGGATATLEECFAPAEASGVRAPADLHERFVKWVERSIPLLEGRQRGAEQLDSAIMADAKIGTLVRLARAKRMLFRGDADGALEVIAHIRRSDLGPVYFWGAVAEQYKHLADVPLPGLPTVESERCNHLLNLALAALIDCLKAVSGKGQPSARLSRPGLSRLAALADALTGGALVPPQAIAYLAQLRSRDRGFLDGLTAENPDILELERQSLALSEEDEARYHAALSALAALELLSLAEAIKDTARTLPYAGMLTPDLKHEIRKLIERKKTLTFAPTPSALQLEELERVL